ncbi:MAG: hypothetical protein J6U31_04580 [Bacteroidales bacterium]|nr:hypothetical protein [Bacteroidales bacterium]
MKKLLLMASALLCSAAFASSENYVAITNGAIASVFENAVAEEGRSVVSFGTDNMEVQAVGGRTPVDVILLPEENFTGWLEWNEPTWKSGNTTLHDNKPGIDTTYFYYIQGSGNPAVEIGVDDPIEKDGTMVYKPKYTYYSPDGSLGMPVMGLYYKFTPKVSGSLKVQIWANKGNRYTYVVKESTKTPISYVKEGYVNGMNQSVTVTMKDTLGNDSIGTMNQKILLTNEQLDSIHAAVLWKYDLIHSQGTISGLTAERLADSIASGLYTNIQVDTIKSNGENDPYIIAGGNQAFWGWITFEVEAGESYWLFQHSSQVGFAGYEFTFGEESGEEEEDDNRTKYIFNINDIYAKAQSGEYAASVSGTKYNFNVDDRIVTDGIFTMVSKKDRTYRVDLIGDAVEYDGYTATARLEPNGTSNSTGGRQLFFDAPAAGTLYLGTWGADTRSVFVMPATDTETFIDVKKEAVAATAVFTHKFSGENSAKKEDGTPQVYEVAIDNAGLYCITQDNGIYYGYVMFATDAESAITNVENEVSGSVEIFNLQGQRVGTMLPGRLYIRNQKKIIIR